MKRAIVVSVRESKDQKTNDELLFVTLYRLPSIMKNGGLWHPKSTEAVTTACYNKTKNPDDYEKFKTLLPCTVCDITYGVNDFNGKTFVANLAVVEKTSLSTEVLYV
jgi:hypothetical protein